MLRARQLILIHVNSSVPISMPSVSANPNVRNRYFSQPLLLVAHVGQ
jgi:hypothetical protein